MSITLFSINRRAIQIYENEMLGPFFDTDASYRYQNQALAYHDNFRNQDQFCTDKSKVEEASEGLLIQWKLFSAQIANQDQEEHLRQSV